MRVALVRSSGGAATEPDPGCRYPNPSCSPESARAGSALPAKAGGFGRQRNPGVALALGACDGSSGSLIWLPRRASCQAHGRRLCYVKAICEGGCHRHLRIHTLISIKERSYLLWCGHFERA